MALNSDPFSNEVNKGGGGGMLAPDDPDYFAKLYAGSARASAGVSAAKRRRSPGDGMLNPRRGLLLTAEQLAGPPAPAYLMRGAYVYGRQNLL